MEGVEDGLVCGFGAARVLLAGVEVVADDVAAASADSLLFIEGFER